jgi:hypothetical protein
MKDPAAVIAVLLLAVFFATFVCVVRWWRLPSALRLTASLLVVIFALFVFPIVAEPGVGPSLWVFGGPLICAIAFAVFVRSQPLAIGGAIFCAVFSLGASEAIQRFAYTSHYSPIPPPSARKGHWNPDFALRRLSRVDSWRDGIKRVPEGYLDEPLYREYLTRYESKYRRSEPIPLWHSRITRLGFQRVRHYRIWTPGGTSVQARQGLRLVPTGSHPRS